MRDSGWFFCTALGKEVRVLTWYHENGHWAKVKIEER
jgi:hypothetical protein